jgi:hypothetical protein
MGRDELSVPAERMCPAVRKGWVDRILSAATILKHPPASTAGSLDTPNVLRRIKRLIWFALVACVAMIGTLDSHGGLESQLRTGLALGVILTASWAIVVQVSLYLRAEEARRAADSEAARLEGARLTASAMQDRIANKLSLTVGYTEFLVTDPRMPEDLREQAQKAMDGAKAAAEQMSELKRLTRLEYQYRLAVGGGQQLPPEGYDADGLRKLMSPVNVDRT